MEREKERGREANWLGFTAPSLTSVGSHCASKKAGFSGRQCCGLYLYPSSCPVAELFTITNSRRTRCLPEGPFSHGIDSRFLWDDLSIPVFLMRKKRKKQNKTTKSRWPQFSCAKVKEFICSRHKWKALSSSLGFICYANTVWETDMSHATYCAR